MKYTIHINETAQRDLQDIYWYVALNDTTEAADKLFEKLENTVAKLESMPLRGHFPPELERIGVLDFREIFYKPYRIIYQIAQTTVYIHSVLDGRRDMQDLLQKRILR